MRSLTTICLLLTSYFTICGQQLFTQDYPIEIYQAASQNWSIRQDKQGVIYFANTEGLVRFDGSKWDLLTLPNKEPVYSVDVDSHGNIYICSDQELGYFHQDVRGSYQYTSLLDKIPATLQSEAEIRLIRVFDDKVFFAGNNIIYIYTNNHFKTLSIDCTGLLMSKNNLFAEKGDALYRYNYEGFDTIPYFKKVPDMKWKWITDYGPNSFLILDDNNQLWIINEKYPDQWNMFSEELNRSLKGLNIFSMTCLDNGNIAVHADDEILFYNKQGRLCYRIERNKLIQWGYLFEDKEHNLWVNAESDIIQIITSSPLSYYNHKNGINDLIISLGKHENHHYVGTSTGILYQQDRNTFTFLPGTLGNTWGFHNGHNKLYAIHDTGILELQGKKVTRISDLDLAASLCTLRDRPYKMIAGTHHAGLWLLEQNANTWSKKKIKGFPDKEVRSILEDEEGNIWISNINHGITKLTLNKQMDSVAALAFYNSTSGLPANFNNRIYRLEGKIVATTINGIYSYNRTSNRFEPVEKYNRALGGLCVYSLTESEAGDIYFWGSKSQQKEMAGVLKKQTDGSFSLLTTPFNKIAVPFRNLRVDVDAPLLVTDSKEVWIGYNLKLFSYNPAQNAFYNDPIQLSIQKVWSRDSLIYQNSSTQETLNTLPYTFNNLKFEFLCSHIEDNEKNQYQYKLKGFENKWSEWTSSKEAFFTNLPEGDYTLYVRAKNVYEVVSTPASLSFRIAPPWYRTRLAYILYFIISILVFNLAIQINTGRVKRRQVYLEEIVKEKTKELIDVNEELLTQSNLLSERNNQLQKAHVTIESQNREIKDRNETLEEEVEKRTKELVKYNQQLEQFAFVTAHNLRGPVARILGLGNVLRMINDVSDEVKTINDKLVFTAHEIDSVIRDLNQILHIKNVPSHLEELDLKTEINKVIGSLEKDITTSKALIRTDFSEVQSITTSQTYFYSIVYHLLSNAIKFRHPERIPDVTISAFRKDDYTGLIVSDNGLGIDLQTSKDKLFTLYSRFHLHVEGKGLGLYLVKTQIAALGGSIEVKSEVNAGTTFVVFFRKVQSH